MADMLREDLAAARKAWISEARRDPDEFVSREQGDFLNATNHAGQVLDFHALRHTCGAWLLLSGASLNVVQSVMRHSTITLTIDTYGHLMPGAEATAVDGLAMFFTEPVSMPAEALKTGTDGAPIQEGAVYAQCATQIPRESHASDSHRTAEILSPAGFEPTTYGLKVPERDGVTSCGSDINGVLADGAQYSPWLERLAIAEPNLSDEQQHFILAVVEREITRHG